MGPVRNGIFYFWMFFNETWHICEGFIENAQEITGREPILSKICITANVQENVILLYKTFYFSKTCAET
jgi:hypothetical protein